MTVEHFSLLIHELEFMGKGIGIFWNNWKSSVIIDTLIWMYGQNFAHLDIGCVF